MAEKVLSRILVQLGTEFENDLNDDYLKLAQLFDPRVCHRISSAAEMDRLLTLAIQTYILKDNNEQAVVDVFSDVPLDYAGEISAFKLHMRKVRHKVGVDENGNNKFDYFGHKFIYRCI